MYLLSQVQQQSYPNETTARVNHDDGEARPSEVRWRNIDLKWIAFDACEVLRFSGAFTRWKPAFKGLHYILGFETGANDERYRGARAVSPDDFKEAEIRQVQNLFPILISYKMKGPRNSV